MAEALVEYLSRQAERDEDTVAAITGTTEEVRRARALRTLGTEDPVAVALTATRLYRKARQTGTLTPDEARRLVAAEIVEGRRTDVGREVEALLAGEEVT
jgi:hypothetical protein